MKIAQIAPLYEAVPPKLYGGSERVVAYLADALVDLGHEVTLFASGGSDTRATLVAGRGTSLRLDPDPAWSELAAHINLLHLVRSRAREFDALHFHTDMIHLPFFEALAGRSVTTLHGRLDLRDLPQTYRNFSRYGLVALTAAQRAPLPEANWIATIPHGIPADLCRLTRNPGGNYLAFLGRISPEKGPEQAIAIARQAGMQLRLAAKVDTGDREYFAGQIEPLIDGDRIALVGEIGDHQKSDFLGQATALLFPIDWPEAFGLVMIEAMACGTPVIAWRRASVPEIVEDGVTGFIVEDVPAAVRAVSAAARLDRARIRAEFDRRFTAETMARAYVDLYRRLTDDG